jgi:hypothetical protein
MGEANANASDQTGEPADTASANGVSAQQTGGSESSTAPTTQTESAPPQPTGPPSAPDAEPGSSQRLTPGRPGLDQTVDDAVRPSAPVQQALEQVNATRGSLVGSADRLTSTLDQTVDEAVPAGGAGAAAGEPDAGATRGSADRLPSTLDQTVDRAAPGTAPVQQALEQVNATQRSLVDTANRLTSTVLSMTSTLISDTRGALERTLGLLGPALAPAPGGGALSLPGLRAFRGPPLWTMPGRARAPAAIAADRGGGQRLAPQTYADGFLSSSRVGPRAAAEGGSGSPVPHGPLDSPVGSSSSAPPQGGSTLLLLMLIFLLVPAAWRWLRRRPALRPRSILYLALEHPG